MFCSALAFSAISSQFNNALRTRTELEEHAKLTIGTRSNVTSRPKIRTAKLARRAVASAYLNHKILEEGHGKYRYQRQNIMPTPMFSSQRRLNLCLTKSTPQDPQNSFESLNWPSTPMEVPMLSAEMHLNRHMLGPPTASLDPPYSSPSPVFAPSLPA